MQRVALMKLAIVCAAALLGCSSEPTYVPKPLPPLVMPTPSRELQPISVADLGFTPGERLVWMVSARGITIGTAELTVGQGEIKSHFATSMLARAFASIDHDLTTTLDGIRPQEAHERLDIDGKARQFTTMFKGTTSHSLHTALGALRVWAHAGAPAGFLQVVVANQHVRVELHEPTGGKDWLRVDGKLVGLDAPATFTCWLDSAHEITRIEIRSDGEQVTAVLVH